MNKLANRANRTLSRKRNQVLTFSNRGNALLAEQVACSAAASPVPTLYPARPLAQGLRGDLDLDGDIDAADYVGLVLILSANEPAPGSQLSSDLNADAVLNRTDLSFLLQFLFYGGDAPALLSETDQPGGDFSGTGGESSGENSGNGNQASEDQGSEPQASPEVSSSPAPEASTEPSIQPSTQPSVEPSLEPSLEQSPAASPSASAEPSAEATAEPSVEPSPANGPQIYFSKCPNRSPFLELEGRSLGGTNYIFAEDSSLSVSDIQSVEFFLNNVSFRRESLSPYDFNGGETAIAFPLDVQSALGLGEHSVRAEFNTSFGVISAEASFTVVSGQGEGDGSSCGTGANPEADTTPNDPDEPSLELLADSLSLEVGETANLSLNFHDTDGSVVALDLSEVEISISNRSLASVDGTVFSALADGIVLLSASFDGINSNTVAIGIGDSSTIGQTTSISKGAITWFFDAPVTYGQFINGDYWVLGPVNIVQITPEVSSSGGRTMNGSMVNPPFSGLSGGYQGFDSGIHGSDFYQNQAGYSSWVPSANAAASVSATNPLVLNPNETLLSAESKANALPDKVQLRSVEALTALSSAPPSGTFRPPYAGIAKPLYNFASVDESKLTSFPNAAGGDLLAKTNEMAAAFSKPFLDLFENWLYGNATAELNNRASYGRDVARDTGRAAVLLNLDLPIDQKRPLLINYLQLGIDLHGLMLMGKKCDGKGGHGNGRVAPILMMQHLFGLPIDLDAVFAEDYKFAWYPPNGTSENPSFDYSSPSAVEVEGAMPDWAMGNAYDPVNGEIDGYRWRPQDYGGASNDYRGCCTALVNYGVVLATYMMGLEAHWPWSATLAYQDRYAIVFTNLDRYSINSVTNYSGWSWMRDFEDDDLTYLNYMAIRPTIERPSIRPFRMPIEWISPDILAGLSNIDLDFTQSGS